MLYYNKIFDFEDKLQRINAMTYDKAQETLTSMFCEKEKAISIVGNTDKPLEF